MKPDGIRLAVGGVSDRPVVRAWPRLDGAELDAAINDFLTTLQRTTDIEEITR